MGKYFFSCLMVFLCSFNASGQTADTAAMNFPGGDISKIMVLTGAQLEAKEDYDKGYALNNDSNFRQAIPYLLAATIRDTTGNCGSGTNGLAFNELGYAYARLKLYDSALFFLDKSILANKENPKSYFNKANLLMKQKKTLLAAETIEQLIRVKPNLAMAYAQLGYIYKADQKKESATRTFREYLRLVNEQKSTEKSKMAIDGVEKALQELENENPR